MWSFIVCLNDHLESCAEYIAKVGQEQEEKDIPYDCDLHVEQQSGGSRLPKGVRIKKAKKENSGSVVNRER
jgi:hypothetical protein